MKLTQKEQIKSSLLAMELIERGARAPIVKSMSPLDRTAIGKLYKEVTGKTSPTGPLPSDPTWFTQTSVPMRLIESSMFIGLYISIKKRSKDANEAQLLIQVYDEYIRHCVTQDKEPRLNINRCWSLVQLYKMGELEMIPCTCCNIGIVQPTYTLRRDFVCCICKRTSSLKMKLTEVIEPS